MRNKESNWYRLDNQAKIFPEVYNKKNPHVFRLQASLTEEINPDILQQTIDNLLDRFPVFKVRLRSGFFWSFLEQNNKPFKISKMDYSICKAIDFKDNNDYLFKLFYHDKTIAIDVFHTLSDGTGIVIFLKAIIYEYLVLSGKDVTPDNQIRTTLETAIKDESEDSSLKYYNEFNRKRRKEEKAFNIQGTTTPGHQVKLVSAIFNTSEIIKCAKTNNSTVTEYITALMIYSIYQTQIQYRLQVKANQKPVKIGVPVNLRTRFPSRTLRNFVNIISVTADLSRNDVSFEEILNAVKTEIKEKTTVEDLTRIMSEYVAYEKSIFVRILPFYLKKYILKVAYSFIGSVLFTLSLSNVGRFEVSESMEPFINDVSFMVGASSRNKLNCSIISFKDKFKISFTSNIIESDIQRVFIRHLTEKGLSCEIESNYLEENNEDL